MGEYGLHIEERVRGHNQGEGQDRLGWVPNLTCTQPRFACIRGCLVHIGKTTKGKGEKAARSRAAKGVIALGFALIPPDRAGSCQKGTPEY